MEKIITYDTLRSFAYSNDTLCTRPIRGLVVSFFGLGVLEMYAEDPAAGRYFAEKGILYLVPYNNPWAWMNAQAVSYTDELIDVLAEHYGLPDTLPIVSTGCSMGGLAALTYMVYAKRTPAACVANCPVCDLPYHYTERPDLPRTLYSALFNEEGTLQEALRSRSPLHLAEKMPAAKYIIFHCEEDMAVNKQQHSDRLVEKLSAIRDVTYIPVPGRGHCDLPEEQAEQYLRFAADAILAR